MAVSKEGGDLNTVIVKSSILESAAPNFVRKHLGGAVPGGTVTYSQFPNRAPRKLISPLGRNTNTERSIGPD